MTHWHAWEEPVGSELWPDSGSITLHTRKGCDHNAGPQVSKLVNKTWNMVSCTGVRIA